MMEIDKSFIIPVIDIKDGIVVGTVAGDRESYGELKSVICNSCDPFEVARCYERLGFRDIYIADLDGILNSEPDIDLIKRIYREIELNIYYDIGMWTLEDIRNLEGVIPVVATETMSSLNLLMLEKDIVVSIDTRNGKLLCEIPIDLSELLGIIRNSSRIREVILLDLDRIGMLKGPNLGLCIYVVRELKEKKVIYGGGINSLDNLYTLYRLGISRALVGSALHSGRIRIDEL
ncbi:MAG: hypothetical protein DRO94_04200 [Candidatus Altiarchaeales archaeon]|nr:MAG: hypothetical protein DRO95_05860 [Candidatus Altiarchaeales archaeon]RLI93865.1 MAG: hypothetical protein DRO94_04200 [Candidatus Altiarchaeales archaeon]HDO82575.1 hypothetical protein [Candidatus Altiarchaeales archaeon]HEX55224.1 hypothetical protein [Candidatus Altiarchaeales archaeon]